MDNKSKDPLKQIIQALTDELCLISAEQTKYFQIFPKDAMIGFRLDEKKPKELAEGYYVFIAFTAGSISRMENTLSRLTEIMIDADKAFQFERITLCDEMLTQYGEFKKSVSGYAELNERLIIKNEISASEMLKYLSELGHKLNYFKEYLKTITF